ncbi:hypothetical protein SAMN05192550_0761 [Flavobacterium glycines]|uniref:CAAX prenyl protease 2/Lysostaphin resistance protein A-like domain-containing protein n=1 Tax=Flavobacterium glycines TaxID=551990 RepID=A0A1B9DTS5_9FLAO|nr:CPBP family intramembrane glutamic endopeptidase [Flavobacterium glycines]OCB73067.1 hypothetical protein FBGL_04130 [Flavobacterium glycines]SDI76810.1 hypothetical protein SAMN05192550_0761 [Flavobacterium glycines]
MQLTTTLLYLISYTFFYVFNRKNIKNGSQRLIDENGDFTSKPKQLLYGHFIGAIWLGFVPVITLQNSFLNALIDLQTIDLKNILLYVLTLIVLLFLALRESKSAHEKKGNSESVFQLSALFFSTYFISRALFLFSYELWLRGALLFETASAIGKPLAITLNVFLYVLLHIFNNRKELLACIPFGITVCLFCFLFNAVWPAIILHIGFSLACEINFYRLDLTRLKTLKS